MQTLDVIFRVTRDKAAEVVAIFPTEPHDIDGEFLTCYAHLGQHGKASREWVRNRTRPATPEEYGPLLAELRGIYGVSHAPGEPAIDLVPCRVMTPAHRAAFNAEVRKHQQRQTVPD